VFGQLKVLSKLSADLKRHEEEVQRGINSAHAVVSDLNDEIRVLEATLEGLNARKALMVAQGNEYSKGIMKERARFTAEYNKLFKKFEG